MTKPALIVNGIGLLLGLTLVGYIAYSAFYVEMEASCSARYPAPTRFPLTAPDGTLLSAMELQARVGLNEWGITGNAKVVADGPGGAALEVSLAPVAKEEHGGAKRENGVYFRWAPAGIGKAGSACLSYSVWLPEGFPFNDGGLLPGIFGGDADALGAAPGTESGFGLRVRWRLDGVGEIEAASAGGAYRLLNQRGFPLSRGNWMRVEQELVLNAPGEANGIARLWVDGALKAEDKGLALRKNANETLIGVLADVGYVRPPGSVGSLRLSPFEIAWR